MTSQLTVPAVGLMLLSLGAATALTADVGTAVAMPDAQGGRQLLGNKVPLKVRQERAAIMKERKRIRREEMRMRHEEKRMRAEEMRMRREEMRMRKASMRMRGRRGMNKGGGGHDDDDDDMSMGKKGGMGKKMSDDSDDEPEEEDVEIDVPDGDDESDEDIIMDFERKFDGGDDDDDDDDNDDDDDGNEMMQDDGDDMGDDKAGDGKGGNMGGDDMGDDDDDDDVDDDDDDAGGIGGESDGGPSGGGGKFSGDLTYYGGAGSGGSCTQTYVPPGFKTVALNAPQYAGGTMCGTCVSACFTDNGGEKCFKAIIDNKCPECKSGDLDLGEGGDGRWPVSWSVIDCPTNGGLKVSAQGSNNSYGKIKFEGGPSGVKGVTCDGKQGQGTDDGYWVFNGDGFCGKGLSCNVSFNNGKTESANAKWC